MHLLSLLSLLLPLSILHLSTAAPLFEHHDHNAGINCYGSSQCTHQNMWWDPIPKYLHIALEAVQPTTGSLFHGNGTYYHRGEHIMCRGNDVVFGTTCLFLEGDHVPRTGVPMQIIIERLAMLEEFHCAICGSVPLSMDDDPIRYGWLTVNYVARPRCGEKGICMSVTKEGEVRGGVDSSNDRWANERDIEDMRWMFRQGLDVVHG